MKETETNTSQLFNTDQYDTAEKEAVFSCPECGQEVEKADWREAQRLRVAEYLGKMGF